MLVERKREMLGQRLFTEVKAKEQLQVAVSTLRVVRVPQVPVDQFQFMGAKAILDHLEL
jgi:hypothetical protein